jgi:integrase
MEAIARTFLGEKILRSITSVDIATYRDLRLTMVNARTQKLISPATVRLELSLLSNLFDVSRIEWGYSDDNPVKNVRKPKSPPGRERRLTPREERLILRYLAMCYPTGNIAVQGITAPGPDSELNILYME